MTNTLTAKVGYTLRGAYLGDDTPGAQAEQFVYELSKTLTDGSGADQVDLVAHYLLTVTPYVLGGDQADVLKQFNLLSMPQTLWGESFTRNFASVKLLYVEHLGDDDAQKLWVGTWAVAQSNNNIWPTKTDSAIGPGDHFIIGSFTDGYATDASNLLFYAYSLLSLGEGFAPFDVRVIVLGAAA